MQVSKASKLVVVCAVLLLAGCARYMAVPPPSATIGDDLVVAPSMTWNRVANAGPGDFGVPELWTIDGDALHALMFFPGVDDGEPLLVLPGGAGDKLPVFRSTMPLEEIASLFEATLTTAANSGIFAFRSISPETVLGAPGLRMEFTYTGKDEVDRQGVAVAAVRDGRLYLIAYQGTRLLHYGKYLPEVERILASAHAGGA